MLHARNMSRHYHGVAMEHPFRTLPLTIVLAATAALAMGSVTADARTAHSPLPTSPTAISSDLLGTNLIRASFIQDGFDREYLIRLPDGHDPAQSYPVILAFGGMGDSAASFRSYAGLEEASANEAIIVYGQGVGNAWAGAPYALTTMEQDIVYVQTAVDDVASNYGGDPERVYAVGMSNGGGMAAALGCHAPELVDGIASVAGAYYDPTVTDCDTGDMKETVPTLLIHGVNDTLMDFDGGVRHGATYLGVREVLDTAAARNHCSAHPGSSSFFPESCDSDTELVTVTGGHDWFYTPSVADITWDFFQEQH